METLQHIIDSCTLNFQLSFLSNPTFVAYAPGRINIIGEHTDYNQGLSMPCAINRWVTVCVAPRKDKVVKVISKDFDGVMRFELGQEYEPKSSWENYVYGCLFLFQLSVGVDTGFNAFIEGNVPIGSGVSSSAALEVAFMNGLNTLSKSKMDSLSLIKCCQQVEHQYLHVQSGLLDQYASQFSKAGQLLVLDFLNLSHRYVSADMEGYVWVLCDSNVQRTLAGSKYSERVLETQKGLMIIQEFFPEVKTFRDIKEKHLSLIADIHNRKRLHHYITENKRTTDAIKALLNKDMDAFGSLITASHLSLRDDYEVSCIELDFLVEEAIATNVCLGSRMMGGGFGGCTINLVKKEEVSFFMEKITKAYQKRFSKVTEINVYQSVDGAGVLPVLDNVQYSS